ncbi:MAG: hypothetical protein JRC77_00025 [Deltaproteobacteria bacterium]|nr:hypothetical protein [Deltaproteobacteria bacterium]
MRGFMLLIGLGLVVAVVVVLANKEPLPPPVDEIDEASREKLERVLEEAEREEAARP